MKRTVKMKKSCSTSTKMSTGGSPYAKGSSEEKLANIYRELNKDRFTKSSSKQNDTTDKLIAAKTGALKKYASDNTKKVIEEDAFVKAAMNMFSDGGPKDFGYNPSAATFGAYTDLLNNQRTQEKNIFNQFTEAVAKPIGTHTVSNTKINPMYRKEFRGIQGNIQNMVQPTIPKFDRGNTVTNAVTNADTRTEEFMYDINPFVVNGLPWQPYGEPSTNNGLFIAKDPYSVEARAQLNPGTDVNQAIKETAIQNKKANLAASAATMGQTLADDDPVADAEKALQTNNKTTVADAEKAETSVESPGVNKPDAAAGNTDYDSEFGDTANKNAASGDNSYNSDNPFGPYVLKDYTEGRARRAIMPGNRTRSRSWTFALPGVSTPTLEENKMLNQYREHQGKLIEADEKFKELDPIEQNDANYAAFGTPVKDFFNKRTDRRADRDPRQPRWEDDEFMRVTEKDKYNTHEIAQNYFGPGMDLATAIGSRRGQPSFETQIENLSAADNVFTPQYGNMGFTPVNPVGVEGIPTAPVQYGAMQQGGPMYKANEVYELTDSQIAEILAAGGEIEYID